jgi:2-dehydropantoate 2-reductase
MSLNYGFFKKGPSEVRWPFSIARIIWKLDGGQQEAWFRVAELLTKSGLDTECVDDIKLYVWKKMIIKCTIASICAVTDSSLKEVLDFLLPEIAENCFREVLAVAKAQGYDLGDEYVHNALSYLAKVGAHKDSMCYDVANKTPTEIDFLGGKVVEYARKLGISTPYYIAMTNLVKAIEDSYLHKQQ